MQEYDVSVERNVPIVMRDGIRLSADIYRPAAGGKFPALFSMSPYGKEAQRYPASVFPHVEAGDIDYFVRRGYAWVIADSRGKYPSEGQWNLFDREEQQDGYELVEWTASQLWCDGKVAGMGMSYFAIIQYFVAALQPPSLKTIVPVGGLTDFYRDFAYYGGIYHSGFLQRWLTSTVYRCLPPQGATPPGNWLPPKNVHLDTMLNSTDGPYYHERTMLIKYDRIKVPVFQIIGPSTLTHRRLIIAYENISSPKKLLIGTGSGWAFLYDESVKQEIARWLDLWLKNIDTGILKEPPVTVYVPGREEWRYENEFPLARTKWTEFYLRGGEKPPASESPYGNLSREKPGSEPPDSYEYPESQKKLEQNQPVLAFLTPPLEEDLELMGSASLVLYASSSVDDTAWVVRIDDVAPGGAITVASMGWLKASHRELDEKKSGTGRPFHKHSNPVPIEPGKIYRYEIDIWPVFRNFKRGHRLRLRIASSDSPHLDGYCSVMLSPDLPTINTIYHDREHPSHMVLPVIPARSTGAEKRPDITFTPVAYSVKPWV